jgi:hypothetical protein
MPDVNEIKAGEYELVADHWDQTVSKPGEPWDFVRHYKGETVTLTVQDARRLVSAGAVAEKGARERARLAVARAQYLAALSALPEELRSQVDVDNLEPRQIPAEELRVHEVGLANSGERPRVASASSGEGDGEILPPAGTGPGAPVDDEPEAPAEAARKRGRS